MLAIIAYKRRRAINSTEHGGTTKRVSLLIYIKTTADPSSSQRQSMKKESKKLIFKHRIE